MTQRERIMLYIADFGSITPWEAFTELGCTKLATRISELIAQGVDIRKEPMTTKNRYGQTCTYMKYSFGEKAKSAEGEEWEIQNTIG